LTLGALTNQVGRRLACETRPRADGSLWAGCSNYERYLDVTLSKNHNLTTGKVYQRVIEKEVRPPYPR
jgi:hypothetical protein